MTTRILTTWTRPKSDLNSEAGRHVLHPGKTRVVIVHPYLKSAGSGGRDVKSRLDEAVGLAAAINLHVVAKETVPLVRIQAGGYLGKGTIERIGELVEETDAHIVSVDTTLSPVQQRTLEEAWRAKVIDRTGLILEIFGERAATREGVLQVELAHLTYQRSRLVRSWTHLERQRGGFGFVGGPGETQIEADRRMISERISKIRRELKTVIRTRELHREARRKVPYPVVALVGYTNAGKSTLFNRLTDAEVFAKDLLFATLDPTMRKIKLPSGRSAILSDTVGFVSHLPTTLIAAFRATLEEVLSADIVVHVRDISHPDNVAQKADVLNVLEDLGLSEGADRRFVEVLNKIDLLNPEERSVLDNQAAIKSEIIPVSAASGENTDHFLQLLDDLLSADREVKQLKISQADGAAISWLYRNADVLSRDDEAEYAMMEVAISPDQLARFEKNQRLT